MKWPKKESGKHVLMKKIRENQHEKQ